MSVILGSIISAVADNTNDSSSDAVTKIIRLINTNAPTFCNLADWKFLRTRLSISLDTTKSKYSGADILPTGYKETLAAYLLDGVDRYDFKEVGIQEAFAWDNPDDNASRPSEFVVSSLSSGFWQLELNRIPDQTYTAVLEIEQQWSAVTLATATTIITPELEGAFVHFISIQRLQQQGDSENASLYENAWFHPAKPQTSIYTSALKTLNQKTALSGVQIAPQYLFTVEPMPDYNVIGGF